MSTSTVSTDVLITAKRHRLPGQLVVPPNAPGVVVFAHGSGSSRLSPRNRQVAMWLNERGCATLLFDLLTEEEAANRNNVFDIPLLGRRVVAATSWLREQAEVGALPVAYFGASTGAAAALVAASELGDGVAAVVSRGGRVDLAGDALPRVVAPTLLLVGSLDGVVLDLNRTAIERMRCTTRLVIVPGASHLFEEPGTLERVADEAGTWFVNAFRTARSPGHRSCDPDA